jgi:hypothetical protein
LGSVEPDDQRRHSQGYHYDDLESLKAHVLAFVTAYNFAKHLKARWRTPYQVICDAWTKDPSIFKINPHHLMPGFDVGEIRIDIDGKAKEVIHRFPIALRTNLHERFEDAARLWEVDMSWVADPGAPPLALEALPRPYDGN